jgi:hypothetical protein
MQQTTQSYRAGMPQLAYTGLSENWLIKECGHRHWEALAEDAGRRAPDFVDDGGSKSYAAFTAIRLTGATLHAIGENDDFELGTELCRTGPARHFSRHSLVSGNGECAIVSMSSTFVRRHEVRNNRSVTRATFAAMGGPTPTPPADAVDMAWRGSGTSGCPSPAPVVSRATGSNFCHVRTTILTVRIFSTLQAFSPLLTVPNGSATGSTSHPLSQAASCSSTATLMLVTPWDCAWSRSIRMNAVSSIGASFVVAATSRRLPT